MFRMVTYLNVLFPVIAPIVVLAQEVRTTEETNPPALAGTWTVTTAAEVNAVAVNWTTPSEVNSDYFLVQRSKEGDVFDDVMQELAGGTTSSISNYSISDYDPYSGISFYRVIQIDFDGKQTIGSKTMADYAKELSMEVYPSPAIGSFNVVVVDGKKNNKVLLVVRDMQGRESFSKVLLLRSVTEAVAIDPEGKLTPGIYTVVATSNNAIYEKKIIIK